MANKRGRSTLFDTHGVNQTLPNVAPVVVVSMKGSSQEEEEARMTSVHYPGEEIRGDKKRKRKRRKHNMKRLLKKMQDDIKSFSRVGVSNYSQILMNCLLWWKTFSNHIFLNAVYYWAVFCKTKSTHVNRSNYMFTSVH